MTTLTEPIIVARAENHPPMLENSMCDSWVSRIHLFIKGKKNDRMMLDSIDNGPLVYQTVEKNGQTRPKKYSELTEAQQLQDNCDVQVTNIILHSLPLDVHDLQGEDLIECINKAMEFLSAMASRLKNNMDAHVVYLEKTMENTNTIHGLVECARKHNPSKPLLASACMFTKHVQKLLVYVSKTRLSLTKPCEKLFAVTPMNKDKKVRFAEPVISLSNIPKQTDSLKTTYSNKPLLTFTGVKPTTCASRSMPSGNTKNNRITRPPSSNQKNKVKEHPRKVKSSLNKINSIFEPISNAHVKHSVRVTKFESICAICNKCLFDANHDMCVIDYVNVVNVHLKSKSERNKMRKVWKPTGKVFSKFGYSWKPTALKVYNRKPKSSRSIRSSSKAKIVESKISNTKEPKQSWGSTISDVPSTSLIDCMLSKLLCGI
nr:hypothetical protein [Tanacetum cinerariifolium]